MTMRLAMVLAGCAMVAIPSFSAPLKATSQSETEPAPTPELAVGQALIGSFFMKPEGDGPFPAIILFGGSEGGDRGARAMAPRFLAEGYAVLADLVAEYLSSTEDQNTELSLNSQGSFE